MLGTRQKKNLAQRMFGPQAMQFWSTLGQGGNAATGMANYNAYGQHQDQLRQQQERDAMMFEQNQQDRYLNNQYRQLQIEKMMQPGPQPERFEDVYNDNGNLIGQRSELTNKYSPLANQNTQRKMYKGGDGFNYWQDNPTERVNPNIQAKPESSSFKIVTKNLPDGGEQDYQVTSEGLIPFGSPKANQTQEKEKRSQKEVIGRTEDALNRYKDLLEVHGTELFPGQAKLNLEGAYRDLQLELKELYNLGVLSGPDMSIMESILKDPTSIAGNFYGGKDILSQLDAVVGAKLQSAKDRYESIYNETLRPPAKGETDQPGLRMGAIEDGYQFLGGDPSKKENWKQINE